jgi:rare lipoprotein A
VFGNDDECVVRASFYASKFEGRRMANGERFHNATVSGASLKYPLGSILLVTNNATGKSIRVRITDRGPWSTKFSLDLSEEAFRQLGLAPRAGWGWVSIRRIK